MLGRTFSRAAGAVVGAALALAAPAVAQASILFTMDYQLSVNILQTGGGGQPDVVTPLKLPYTGQLTFEMTALRQKVTAGALPGQVVRTYTADITIDDFDLTPDLAPLVVPPDAVPYFEPRTMFTTQLTFSRTETRGVADGDGFYKLTAFDLREAYLEYDKKDLPRPYLWTEYTRSSALLRWPCGEGCPRSQMYLETPDAEGLAKALTVRNGERTPNNTFKYGVSQTYVTVRADGADLGPYAAYIGDMFFKTARLSGSLPEPGGVPEPATWALMILGFGLVGATLRGRRLA